MSSEDSHHAQVVRILGMFQTLELSLKIYISAAYQVIKCSVPSDFHFDYGYKDVQNSPLEKLLGIFKKLNGDRELQDRIGKILSIRNDLAHRALMYRHDVVRDLLGVDIEDHASNLADAEMLLDGCLLDMASQMEAMVQRVPPSVD